LSGSKEEQVHRFQIIVGGGEFTTEPAETTEVEIEIEIGGDLDFDHI
jgi:hypothetical protein